MTRRRISPAIGLIVAGSSLFIFVLWLSAYLESDIRWLHFFQAWMYIAAVALSLRHSRWGYFVGVSAAGLWDYINLFVTSFFRSGLHWTFGWISSGQLQRLDQIVAVPGWIGNLLVIVGSIWAYLQMADKRRSDLARVVFAFVLTTAFFAAAIGICQPRYLPLFRAMLHPHSPW
ncbi:MAG: hypothetical protein DME70_08705 [Verrucomicrobia bacterium]|nr:MAG: hypothetical protein DME70_08705 [Verrucomicrobiota bacterium]